MRDGLARVPRADDPQELLGIGAEHGDEHELLLARGEAFRLLAHVLGGHRLVLRDDARREQTDRSLDGRVDRLRGVPVRTLDERAELVDHGPVPPRFEHVQERLAGEDLPDRRRERRPAGLRAHRPDLLEHLLEPVRGRMGAQVHVERGDESRRQVVLGSAHRDPRRNR